MICRVLGGRYEASDVCTRGGTGPFERSLCSCDADSLLERWKEESFFSENAADDGHGTRKGAIGETNGNVARNISAKERAVCDIPKQEKTSRCVAGVITATEELVQHLKGTGIS